MTSKKSLNSWWSVNTGGEGRGGPNNGTLSSEKIFNLQNINITLYHIHYATVPQPWGHNTTWGCL